MNLVEISEMLKGVPDTYLTKHVQAPDGTVPQYLALAELQRRQDMRARFAQQAPQSTVADDAVQGAAQGIAAAAPEMAAQMPAKMPAEVPAGIAGYRDGGRVKSRKELIEEAKREMEAGSRLDEIYTGDFFQSPFQSLLKMTGFKPTDRQRSVAARYEAGQELMDAAARERMAAAAARNADILGAARQRQAKEAAKYPVIDKDQMAVDRQYDEMMVAQAGYGPTAAVLAAREAADAKAFEQAQFDNMMAELAGKPMRDRYSGIRPDLETGKLPPGYEEYESEGDYGREEAEARAERIRKSTGGYSDGGAVDRYISRAGTFESGNNRNAKNPFSSASGRFQFIDSTRRRLDKKYGFDPKDRSDETEMARMRAYTNETIDTLEKNNIPVTGGTLYGGHFLGQGGIKKFFEAYRKDPNTNVSEHFSAEIIRKNPAIFNPRGGKARTTLAEVMEKFDRIGGGKQRTPMTDEDMNLGAAIQVANRADRGDIGPYEDMNLSQATALANLLEESKLGRGPMARPQREPDPSFFYNPVDQQVRAQLLQRYTNPGIMGSIGGFADGGMVKGYSGADGVSSVGAFYIDVNGVMRDSATGEPVSDYIAADLRPNKVRIMQNRVVPTPRPENFRPGSGAPVGNFYTDTSGISSPIAVVERNPVTVIGGGIMRETPQKKNKPEKEKEESKGYGGRKPGSEDYDIAKLLGPSAYARMTTPAFGSAEEADLLTYPAQALVHGKNFIENFVPGAIMAPAEAAAGLAATGAGVVSDVFTLPAGELKRKWAAERAGIKSTPSKFFYIPESAAGTGGSGILGGAEIELPPIAPRARPTAEEVAAAGQRMREEAGVAPTAPAAATPPASQADSFADQFLKELRDAKMSKEEMRQMALLQAGLGMMAGTSPNFGVNVGQGAMAGLQAYQQAKAQNQALASEAYKNMMAARALGLDERRVEVAEQAQKGEEEYRKESINVRREEIAAALAKAAGSAGIKPEDLRQMSGEVEAAVREEIKNPLSPLRKPDGSAPSEPEIQNIIRLRMISRIQTAASVGQTVSGAPTDTVKMGSAI